ncbi:MAG: 30S ribosomal protein S16, partial [Candidatus Marinimicrobia bacterium]|nr:30S ribosomal protein S16 [Candidatus Neomarinimicrobiota bacterium]
MATKIRLKRIGRRNRPFYRLVIMDARKRRDGAGIEEVGWYNPTAKDEMYSLKEDRILYWLEEGAQPTDTAHDILRTAGLAHKWHLMKQGLDETAVEKEMKKWALEREDVLERRRQRAEAKVAKKKAAAGKKAAETVTEVDKPAEPDAKTEPPAETVPTDKAPDGTADKSADEKEEPKEEDVKDDAGADESKEDSAAE